MLLQDLDDGGEELFDAVAALGVEVGRGLALAETAEVVIDGWIVHSATLGDSGLRLALRYPLQVQPTILSPRKLVVSYFKIFQFVFLVKPNQEINFFSLDSQPPRMAFITTRKKSLYFTWSMVGTMEL